MDEVLLTKSEQRCFDILLEKSGKITSRDEIAQSVWQNRWLEKYSDWQIDRLIYLLRKKLPKKYSIKTLRNSGYILLSKGVSIPKLKTSKVKGTQPTDSYLEYMNNPKNKRKVLKDMYKSINFKLSPKKILVVNSYSYDNVDSTYKKFPNSEVYFSNFDARALKLHQEEIEKLSLEKVYTAFDDIRNSIFKDNFFDLVINDFRLNFNLTNKQNIATIENIYRILKKGGFAAVSVVIDPRYKDNRINKDKPYHFEAEEGLVRKCFTSAYYEKLFANSGFKIIKEFDIENGKKWKPEFRRFLLQK